jgi:multidrug efflux system membrane fusion protein
MAANAEHDKVRFTTLSAQGAASGQQRDTAVATASADKATVEADKALVQSAQLNLGYTRILSPISGKTGPILIQPGNVITANNAASPLVTIAQLQPIKVSMFLAQSNLPLIQRQMAAHRLQMAVNNGGGATFSAPVNFVGNQVDPRTGTVELRATFDNGDLRLVPGQLLDAAVSLSTFAHAIVVPRDAVNVGPESRYVFVVGADNRAEMRPAKVLYDDGVNATIEARIKPGDRVITEGQLRVIPNRPVEVVNSARARAGP